MLYIHCIQLRLCQEGQLLSLTVLGQASWSKFLVLGLNSFNINWLLSLLGSRGGKFFDKRMYKSPDSAYKGNMIPMELLCCVKLDLIDCEGGGYLTVLGHLRLFR